MIKQDLDLIRKKLRCVRAMPESTCEEYNLKQDLIQHWLGEREMLSLVSKISQRVWK